MDVSAFLQAMLAPDPDADRELADMLLEEVAAAYADPQASSLLKLQIDPNAVVQVRPGQYMTMRELRDELRDVDTQVDSMSDAEFLLQLPKLITQDDALLRMSQMA